jgi:hypothetical protein
MNHIGKSSIAVSKLNFFEQPIALPPLNVQEVTEEKLVGIAASTISPKLVAVILATIIKQVVQPARNIQVDKTTEPRLC